MYVHSHLVMKILLNQSNIVALKKKSLPESNYGIRLALLGSHARRKHPGSIIKHLELRSLELQLHSVTPYIPTPH